MRVDNALVSSADEAGVRIAGITAQVFLSTRRQAPHSSQAREYMGRWDILVRADLMELPLCL